MQAVERKIGLKGVLRYAVVSVVMPPAEISMVDMIVIPPDPLAFIDDLAASPENPINDRRAVQEIERRNELAMASRSEGVADNAGMDMIRNVAIRRVRCLLQNIRLSEVL